MNENLPSVTVLIAARPGQAEINAVTAGKKLDYPREKLSILVARGRQPSVQRNAALREVGGEIIYFLDDDSTPPPGNLLHAIKAFADPKVQMIGGPNLCPSDAPFIEQVFALVHASWLAFFSSRARYVSVGVAREASEKELILCNLLTRRSTMLELGGFNEALYPNEENALMDEMQKRGGKLIYDPALIVHRRPRSNLKSFAKMLLNYGRGRAEQIRLHPTLGSAPNFVPPLFCVYLLGILIVAGFGKMSLLVPMLIPLGVYCLMVIGQAVALVAQGGIIRSICAMPLIFLTHFLYGVGFWRGLFTSLRKPTDTSPKTTVVIEKISL